MSFSRRSLQNVTCYFPSRAYNGYTLYAFMGECGAWLVDMKGNFVHRWNTLYIPAAYGKLLDNGNLLYGGQLYEPVIPGFGGLGGKLQELDWDGNVVWEYDDPFMHHDFARLPNGNTMILRFVETPRDFAAKIKGGIPGSEREGVIWSDSFQEITPDGKVVWEWLAYEHLDPDEYSICPLDARAEWTHINTCHVLPNGDILTSFLRQNTIGIIDKATGRVKWKWGGDGILGHQHDPTMLENGNILVFDNGTHRMDNPAAGIHYGMINFSRVLEIDPKTNEIVWEYRDDWHLHFHAPYISGSQRLPNGNTLICEGPTGRFFEVTQEKEIVWEFINPFFNNQRERTVGICNAVFRAYRYSLDHPAFQEKDLTPERFEMCLRERPIYSYNKEKERANILDDRIRRLGY